MLEFDPIMHAYTLNGKRIPGVTSVLAPLSAYSSVPQHLLAAAAIRGSHIHKACELFLLGVLDEEALSETYKPYLSAFKKFLVETRFKALQIEERVYHKSLMYAGTLDLGGTLPAIGRGKTKRALIDIKTTFKLLASVGPQTAAYFEAWNSMHDQCFEERYGLQLKADGTYKMLPFKAATDMNIFRSCLNIYNFMRKTA